MRTYSRRVATPLLALATLGASIGFFASETVRSNSPVSSTVGDWAFVWQILLFAGGMSVIFGWLRDHTDFEALGMTFIGFGTFAYVMAIISVLDWGGWASAWLLSFLGLYALFYAWSLSRGNRWP